jgi:hypothetical protein
MMNRQSPDRAPWFVWAAWIAAVLDLLGFFAVFAGFSWGPAKGEGALGCAIVTLVAFVPLMFGAWIITLLWIRAARRRRQAEAAIHMQARLLRRQREEK